MARQPEQHRSDPVVAAIERVLKTERDGVEALRQSAAESERLLTQARAQAADIARRTDNLISRLHAAYLQKVQAELQQFAAADPVDGDRLYNPTTLAEAARQVAAKLTGGA
ncbi:MAG: hypothetical protein K9G60_03940 [Pseudolabrys sp.]|nr:hypothetical protein [Pseudolabrys sp.]